jgi:hypothetical protein
MTKLKKYYKKYGGTIFTSENFRTAKQLFIDNDINKKIEYYNVNKLDNDLKKLEFLRKTLETYFSKIEQNIEVITDTNIDIGIEYKSLNLFELLYFLKDAISSVKSDQPLTKVQRIAITKINKTIDSIRECLITYYSKTLTDNIDVNKANANREGEVAEKVVVAADESPVAQVAQVAATATATAAEGAGEEAQAAAQAADESPVAQVAQVAQVAATATATAAEGAGEEAQAAAQAAEGAGEEAVLPITDGAKGEGADEGTGEGIIHDPNKPGETEKIDDKSKGGNKHNSYLTFKTKDGKTIKKKIYLIKGKEKVRDGMKDNKINYIALSTYKKKYK